MALPLLKLVLFYITIRNFADPGVFIEGCVVIRLSRHLIDFTAQSREHLIFLILLHLCL